MDTRIISRVIAACMAACLILGCGGSKPQSDQTKTSQQGADFPREKTLYVGGDQWGEPNTFNPLQDWPAWPVRGKDNVMYEPLMMFNLLSGELEPLLAHSLQKSPDTISVILDSRAKWSDGEPLTSEDVVFTYEIGLRFKSSLIGFLKDLITGVNVEKVPDPVTGGKTPAEKIKFIINKKERNNPLAVLDQLWNVRIVPKHVVDPMLQKVGNDWSEFLKEKMDVNPVVSGPYNLFSYSGEKIVLKRRDDYWGNAALHGGRLPAPEFYIHPIFKSNDHFSVALQQGDLDISQSFIPRIWMKAKSGVKTWYKAEPYFVPGVIPMLRINCTRGPLADKNFRRAMAYAVNYKEIKDNAVSGYSPDLQPGLILPYGLEKKYFCAEDAAKYGALYDTAKAKEILKKAGYKSEFDKQGNLTKMVGPDGKQIQTLSIMAPAGWSDWEAIVRIAVKSMRAVGIDIREGFVDSNIYWQSIPFGSFDLIMHKPDPVEATPSKPWSRFDVVMSSRNWQPEGGKMFENQGRYNKPGGKDYNPNVDKLL
jgi:peptide/nickel transport system substrate-binding protein